MNMRRWAAAAWVAAVGMMGGCAGTGTEESLGRKESGPAATAPAAKGVATMPGVVSAEMLQALGQLSAEDYQVRQAAGAKLEVLMTRQFQQMVAMQELMLRVQENLGEQLRQMALAPEAESQARVAGLMEFSGALARWAGEVLALPEPRREAMLRWGLAPGNSALVARAYARKTETRVAAARELAKLDGEMATWLLERLLNDPEREVALAVMDGMWDKPATPSMVEILWSKATAWGMQQFRPQPNRQRNVNVHGRVIVLYDQDYNNNQGRMQDAEVAVDVLIQMKSPLVGEKLRGLFGELTLAMRNPNDASWRMFSPNYGDGARALARLVGAYRPKEAVVFFMSVLTANAQDGYNQNLNNAQYRQSSRADAAGMLLQLTQQDPEEYKLRKLANYGDRWMVVGTEKEEEEMVGKWQGWWREHYKEYGGEEPPKGVKGAGAAGQMVEEAREWAKMAAEKRAEQAARAAEVAKKKAAGTRPAAP